MDFKFFCPFCSQHIQVDSGSSGSCCPCPNCNKTITIPNPNDTLMITKSPKRRSGRRLLLIIVLSGFGLSLVGCVLLVIIGSVTGHQNPTSTGSLTDNTGQQSAQSTQPTKSPEQVLSEALQQEFSERKQELFNEFHPIGQAQSITVHVGGGNAKSGMWLIAGSSAGRTPGR
jgi:hypothetical protein